MISEIERGIRNPSISILWNLANTLKTPLNFFLKDPVPDTAVIYRAGTLPDITGPGYRYHPLMNFDDTKRIELYSGVFIPAAARQNRFIMPASKNMLSSPQAT